MEKPKKSNRLQSESSEDEEDFESADEGEGSEQIPRPPSLLATSADDHKNSTSKNQVSKDRTAEKPCEMAAREASLTFPSDKPEKVEESDGDSAKAREFLPKEDIDRRVDVTSADLKDEYSCSGLQEEKPAKKEDKKPSRVEYVQQDVSDDDEIQFKTNSNKKLENTIELEDTSAEPTSVQNKESIDGKDNDGNVKNDVESKKESSIGKTTDVPGEKWKDNIQDESLTSVDDALKFDKDLKNPAEPGAAESAKPAAPWKDGDTESQSEGSWGWGSWETMLSSVSSGISSVIETVETSLGIPEPEVIAKQVTEDEKQAKEMKARKVIETEPTMDSSPEVETQETSESIKGEEDGSYFTGFGVRGLSDVVSEGLGALEYIGKKTMDAISDGDPGLRNKREFLVPKEATLSQILREAKEEAEYKTSHPDHKEPAVNFSTEFDKFQGLAHLEALEILSKESLSKVEERIIDLSSDDLKSVKPLLRTIQEVLRFTEDEEENDDDEDQDFESEVSEVLKDINLSHVPNKTIEVDKRVKVWINACVAAQNEAPLCKDHTEIFTMGISALAELTANTIEQFHKIAEVLLLLAENTDTSALVRAQSLKKLTMCVCREVSILSSKFASCLSAVSKESQDPEAIESLITTLYLESSDSSRYLQHALKLLCPVLQHSSLSENTNTEES